MASSAQGNVVYLGRSSTLGALGPGFASGGAAKRKPAPTSPVPDLPPKPVTQQPPAALPMSGEPLLQDASASGADLAIRQAMLGTSAGKLVSTLVAWRDDGAAGAEQLEAFATAMAGNLGMTLEDARLLADAMSRGTAESRSLAEAINALRTMKPGERASWMARWLPAARAGAGAVIELAQDPLMKSLGASPAIANALGALAAMTMLMVDRKKQLPAGSTLEARADEARRRTIELALKPNGTALLVEADKIGRGDDTDMAARAELASDLVRRYAISEELAFQVVDALRNKTQVGKLVAGGLADLEKLGTAATGFTPMLFENVRKALAAEAAIAADPFKREVGAFTEDEVMPIADLARYVESLEQYARRRP